MTSFVWCVNSSPPPRPPPPLPPPPFPPPSDLCHFKDHMLEGCKCSSSTRSIPLGFCCDLSTKKLTTGTKKMSSVYCRVTSNAVNGASAAHRRRLTSILGGASASSAVVSASDLGTGMIQREIQDGVEVKKHIEEPPVLLNLADEHFLLIV